MNSYVNSSIQSVLYPQYGIGSCFECFIFLKPIKLIEVVEFIFLIGGKSDGRRRKLSTAERRLCPASSHTAHPDDRKPADIHDQMQLQNKNSDVIYK